MTGVGVINRSTRSHTAERAMFFNPAIYGPLCIADVFGPFLELERSLCHSYPRVNDTVTQIPGGLTAHPALRSINDSSPTTL